MNKHPAGGSLPDGVLYEELTILSRDNQGTNVQWHDSLRESILIPNDQLLNIHPIGTNIGVIIRLGTPEKGLEVIETIPFS